MRGWFFFLFIWKSTSYFYFLIVQVLFCDFLVFNIMQYSKDIVTWQYHNCYTATRTSQNWAIIMNEDPNTVRISINMCLCDDNSSNKAIFHLTLNFAHSSILFTTKLARYSLPAMQFFWCHWGEAFAQHQCSVCCALHLEITFA